MYNGMGLSLFRLGVMVVCYGCIMRYGTCIGMRMYFHEIKAIPKLC